MSIAKSADFSDPSAANQTAARTEHVRRCVLKWSAARAQLQSPCCARLGSRTGLKFVGALYNPGLELSR